MSNILYYYAKLNENNICYGFETLAKKFREEELPSNLIALTEYNETYLYRKYDRDLKAFSQESYEPSLDTKIQEKLETLETENQQLKQQIQQLLQEKELSKAEIAGLQSALAEISMMMTP